jgi:hypothetical protein
MILKNRAVGKVIGITNGLVRKYGGRKTAAGIRFAAQVAGSGLALYDRYRGKPYAQHTINKFVGRSIRKPVGRQSPHLAGPRKGRPNPRNPGRGQHHDGNRRRGRTRPSIPSVPSKPKVTRKRHNLRSYKYRNKFRFYY